MHWLYKRMVLVTFFWVVWLTFLIVVGSLVIPS